MTVWCSGLCEYVVLKKSHSRFLRHSYLKIIGRSYSRDDLATRPLLCLLERLGITVGSAEQTISATLSDVEVSAALEIELGSPLLSIQRIVYDEEGTPVEFIKALYRPDRYQHRMMLSRVGNERARTWAMGGD